MAQRTASHERGLIEQMRAAFARDENAMAVARDWQGVHLNTSLATEIAYDLQAGSYAALCENKPEGYLRWTTQLADVLRPMLQVGDSLVEVGTGDGTTLAGVAANLRPLELRVGGTDLSWSRCKVASTFLADRDVDATVWSGDMFAVPLADKSVDVVFTSHAIEPNGGREGEAVAELIRIARRAVVLFEPIYELASEPAQERMREHGYARGLYQQALDHQARVMRYELLPYCANPLNPTGVIVLDVSGADQAPHDSQWQWQCPVTGAPMAELPDVFFAASVGLAYPVLRGIPVLRPETRIVASMVEG